MECFWLVSVTDISSGSDGFCCAKGTLLQAHDKLKNIVTIWPPVRIISKTLVCHHVLQNTPVSYKRSKEPFCFRSKILVQPSWFTLLRGDEKGWLVTVGIFANLATRRPCSWHHWYRPLGTRWQHNRTRNGVEKLVHLFCCCPLFIKGPMTLCLGSTLNTYGEIQNSVNWTTHRVKIIKTC